MSTADLDRRPGRLRDARVDASIHQATLDVVCEKGFGGASKEIASRATGECPVPDTGTIRGDLLGLWDGFGEVFVDTLAGQLFNDLLTEARRNPVLTGVLAG